MDIEKFSVGGTGETTLKQQLGLTNHRIVGFIGSFYAYEGLDLLLQAFPTILKTAPDARLLLVGGGPQDNNLKHLAVELGIQDKVIFTGRVPHDQVQRYYDLVDILAYPRHSMRLTELVTPLKPLEAMAQGRLLVASDVGGHKELIQDGKTGILFKAENPHALANAVLQLFAEESRWPVLRMAARQFVETERNWPKSVSNYVAIYNRLAGKSANNT